ncbi:MAG: TPM domain-containing protein [Thermodesulfovibrionales bacterium]|nr:TPM domain-containing protein [Thermodesulfovibrionales bacterium]
MIKSLVWQRFFFIFIFFCSIFVTSSIYCATPAPPSIPPGHVVDLANIIKEDIRIQLSSILKDLEHKTSVEVVILTIHSLDGEDIEKFSLKTAEKWRLGKKDKDNGLLITIALKERKYRFEVGYGLEGVLPDSLVGSIGRQYLVPYFKKGDYSTGIYIATTKIVQVILSNQGKDITGSQRKELDYKKGANGKGLSYLVNLLFLLFLLIFIKLFFISFRFARHSRKGNWTRGGGFGGGGIGGFGGSWGGGGGGFSGGGGSFGGGGASGRW